MPKGLVQSRSMNKDQSIQEAGRVWRNTVGDLGALKRRIRAEAEAQIELEVEKRRATAARAIHFAWEQGATRAALRQVTTKDHHGFAAYLALGEELAREGSEKERGKG